MERKNNVVVSHNPHVLKSCLNSKSRGLRRSARLEVKKQHRVRFSVPEVTRCVLIPREKLCKSQSSPKTSPKPKERPPTPLAPRYTYDESLIIEAIVEPSKVIEFDRDTPTTFGELETS